MPDLTPSRSARTVTARTIPVHRALPPLIRDPLRTLVDVADHADGDIVRLNLGTFRPYLISHPEDVQHILRENAQNYIRDGKGMLWRPIKRLFGEGVLAEGRIWESSRRALQPLFTAKRIDSLADELAEAIGSAVDRLAQPARDSQPVDIGAELSHIVCRAIMRVLFADRVSVPDALRITDAQDTVATTLMARLLVPFIPNVVPMPGDRAFRGAVATIDEILLPVVRAARADPGDDDDVIATLVRSRDADGNPLDERQVRNDTVAMFATSTETTYGVLTWLWPILRAHPDVAARLYAEIDDVVGPGPVRGRHLPDLRYTRMVLDELLRLYPVAWLMPRTAVTADVVGGVPIPAGASVLISPYLTQRLAAIWPDPEVFDPQRFAGGRAERRPRYAHFPFGGGPHQCLGQHLFYLEAHLIVATILTRFRCTPLDERIPVPRAAASLRPSAQVMVRLQPRDRAGTA